MFVTQKSLILCANLRLIRDGFPRGVFALIDLRTGPCQTAFLIWIRASASLRSCRSKALPLNFDWAFTLSFSALELLRNSAEGEVCFFGGVEHRCVKAIAIPGQSTNLLSVRSDFCNVPLISPNISSSSSFFLQGKYGEWKSPPVDLSHFLTGVSSLVARWARYGTGLA